MYNTFKLAKKRNSRSINIYMFEPQSSRHVETLGKSFTGSALVFWCVNSGTMRML